MILCGSMVRVFVHNKWWGVRNLYLQACMPIQRPKLQCSRLVVNKNKSFCSEQMVRSSKLISVGLSWTSTVSDEGACLESLSQLPDSCKVTKFVINNYLSDFYKYNILLYELEWLIITFSFFLVKYMILHRKLWKSNFIIVVCSWWLCCIMEVNCLQPGNKLFRVRAIITLKIVFIHASKSHWFFWLLYYTNFLNNFKVIIRNGIRI